MTKKIIALLVGMWCVSGAFAQVYNDDKLVKSDMQEAKAIMAYKKFDFFYYNEAVTKTRQEIDGMEGLTPAQKEDLFQEAKSYLDNYAAYRAYNSEYPRTSSQSTSFWGSGFNERYKEMNSAFFSKQHPSPQNEAQKEQFAVQMKHVRSAFSKYSKRPATLGSVLADPAKNSEYEELMFNTIKGSLSQGGACLEKARALRVAAPDGTTAQLRAQYKQVRACLDTLQSRADRLQIEGYLGRPVAREGKAYYMPLADWAK